MKSGKPHTSWLKLVRTSHAQKFPEQTVYTEEDMHMGRGERLRKKDSTDKKDERFNCHC